MENEKLKTKLTIDELLVVANEIYTEFFWEIYYKTGSISTGRTAAEKARNAYLEDEYYELVEEGTEQCPVTR